MNVSHQKGISVVSDHGRVFINEKEIPTPKGMKTNSQTVINGRVFIGGYEYLPSQNKFKRTLRAIWELLF